MREEMQQPRSANRTHAPELERWAENQRPKTAEHREPKLYRYEGAHLYQWFSKRGASPFEDPCDEPFVIEPRSEGPADLKAVEIHEAEVPEIIERGARGEALSVSQQAAWTGYELGWRDGRADPPADLKAVREALEPTYDALWELVAALAQHPTLKLGGRLAEALEGGRKAALAEHARRRAAEVYAALNLSETVDGK